MKLVGVDVGSTTVKAAVVEDGKVTWQDYQRHNTKQAEKVVEFLGRMEAEAGLTAGTDRVFFTGSGAGFISPLVGGKLIQEVVAVAACVEQQHPDVRFVSEIGGEDMKTIFFTARTDFTAQDAWRMGLVNQVVPKAQLEAFTRDYATKIARNAPLTIRSAKNTVDQLVRPAAERDLALLDRLLAECFNSQDYQEGVKAFSEKRRPEFQGR